MAPAHAENPRMCVKKGLALLRWAGYKFTCADIPHDGA